MSKIILHINNYQKRIIMNRPLHLCLVSILLLFSGMISGQNTVKLFNSTNNREKFIEIYHYGTVTYKYSQSYISMPTPNSPSSLWNFTGNPNPFLISKNTPRETVYFTNNLNEYLLYQDSVQITTAIKDSLSPILILQFLKEELAMHGIIAQYPVKNKQPATYIIEISSCECRYKINSRLIPKGKKKPRYTGNYQVEYAITWKERKNNKVIPVEDETKDRIAYEWEYKPKTDMKELPNLSTSMTKLCWRIAKTKAVQIVNALKENNDSI